MKEFYVDKSLTNWLYLEKRFYTLRINEGTYVKSYLNEFNSIIINMKNVDITILDEDETILVLCSLPPPYDLFLDTLSYKKELWKMCHVRWSLKR